MQNPNLSISVLIDKLNKTATIKDDTDYVSLNIDPSKVYISLRLDTPVGLIYINPSYNTPLVSPNLTGVTNTFVVNNLPFIDGEILNGEYKLHYRLFIKNNNAEEDTTGTTYDYESKSIISYNEKCVKIEVITDCFCAKFISKDITDYSNSTQLTYSHIIHYPQAVDEPNHTANTLIYSENRLANGTYNIEVVSQRSWNYGVFNVVDTLVGNKDFKVDCSGLCDIKCAFSNLYERYERLSGKNQNEAKVLLEKINKSIVLISLMNFFRNCGDTIGGNKYLNKLKDVLGDCNCGCDDCNDEDGGWVSGVCGSMSTPEFNTTDIYNTINNINTNLSNLISQLGFKVDDLENILDSYSWLNGKSLSCLIGKGMPNIGTNSQEQFLLDSICMLLDKVADQQPVASNDYASTEFNTPIERLVTLNDFFASDVIVTITTPPINGTAIVLADNKTIRYTPNTGFIGTETIGYTITDQNTNTSNANFVVVVNPAIGTLCSVVNPIYNASVYSVGSNLQISIANQSNIGSNIIVSKNYIIEIRDNTNAILYSYSVTGSPINDPTIFTTPIPISNNWNNVRIQMLLTTKSSSGASCGMVTYETPTPFLLTDVSVSWFDGVTIPLCLGITGGDNEVVKKQKTLDKVCQAYNNSLQNALDIDALEIAVNALPTVNGYTDISSSITVGTGFVATHKSIREYNDGTIKVDVTLEYTTLTDKPIGTSLLIGLPARDAIYHPIISMLNRDNGALSTPSLYLNPLTSEIVNLVPLIAPYAYPEVNIIHISFDYKKY